MSNPLEILGIALRNIDVTGLVAYKLVAYKTKKRVQITLFCQNTLMGPAFCLQLHVAEACNIERDGWITTRVQIFENNNRIQWYIVMLNNREQKKF